MADRNQKQPETPEEEARCREALAACPVDAIGCDGEPAAACDVDRQNELLDEALAESFPASDPPSRLCSD